MMTHPFMPDLSDKSLEELQQKMAELTKNLNFAHRMQNSAVIGQLHMILTGYREAYAKKMDDAMNKQDVKDKIKIDN
jgi:ribosomal protein L29